MEVSETITEAKAEPGESSKNEPTSVQPSSVDLSSRWEIAAITHFAGCFHKIWHLPQVYAEDIEDGCSAVCEDLASQFFTDFFIGLLQSFRKCVEINRDNYEIYLKRIAIEAGKGELLERFADQSFWALPTIHRIELLMALCYARIDFDVNNPEGKLKDIDASLIRAEPLGEDAAGITYWHFGDTRLYRDIPPPPPPPPPKKQKTPKSKPRKKGRGRRGKKKGGGNSKANKSVASAADTSALETSMDVSVVAADKVEPKPEPPTSKWELVCSTEDQWQTFFADLSQSKKAADIELYHIMSEQILPVLQEIFAEKERVMKKRLLMLAPRRQSYRLEEKRKAFHDAERFISYIASDGQLVDNGEGLELPNGTDLKCEASESEYGGSEQPSSRRKFRRAPLTNEEALERKRQQEEEMEKSRLKAASARANRANRRAEGLPASGLSDTESHGGDYEDDKSDYSEDLEMDYMRMEEILASVTKHQDSGPFREPVPTTVAPDYYEIIKCPMDLNVMSRKLMQRQYTNISEMIADFDQLCQNCVTYNGPQNPYSTMVRRLSRHFQSQLRQNFPQAARERLERGYVGQVVHHANQSRQAANRTMDSEIADEAGFTSPSPDPNWDGGAVDPDWSPRRDHVKEPRPRSEKPPKRRRTTAPATDESPVAAGVGGGGSGGYSALCNNLDQLLGTEVDGEIISGAVNEMASIRAKGSSKRTSLPLQPKPSDFLTGYKRSQRQQAAATHSQPAPRSKRQAASEARQHMHQYSMQHQDSIVNSPQPTSSSASALPRTATVLKQTPTGLTSLPGAYFRPTIGELPPPVRRVTSTIAQQPPASSSSTTSSPIIATMPSATTNGAALRSLLMATPGSSAASTAIRYKPVLVAAAKPQQVQIQLQQQQPTQHHQQAQPVAYVLPISLAQGSTSGTTTVLLVQGGSGTPVSYVGQPGQQISLTRVATPQTDGSSSTQKQPPPTNNGTATPSTNNNNNNNNSGNTPGGQQPQQQQSFSNAFFKFVSSSSARV